MNLDDWKAGDWAAWAQAIASVLAIIFAGRIATTQAKSQYDNSLRLQTQSEEHKKLVLTEAVSEVVKNTASRVRYIKDTIGDDTKLYNVFNKIEYYDHDCLEDIIDAIKDIPLHELPSPELVTTIMVLTSTLRQLNIQIEKAITSYRFMDTAQLDKFFLTINEIVISTEKVHQETLSILQKIKSEQGQP
jgi:hypothetical protein